MCIFCKIIEKEIPAQILYEDETVVAFLDISQVTKGHTLVIPKKHCKSFLDCDQETMLHVMRVAQHLSQHLVNKLQANGMNLLSNAHEAAGQTVFHFHVHLIPRYDANDACIIHFQDSQPQDIVCLQKYLSLK